ncbi:MAG: GTP 3',8-cyclase MoaA [Candidatus Hydrogenedentes bacterium]|nr:GTP 3',8-cyclase MoaA [Candidatus Hydrogenedentota bacterium]
MDDNKQLVDGFGRTIDYLRVSVTDFCNLRCRYCMPETGVEPMRHDELLTFEEIQEVVRYAAEFGFRKVRITGGEPLIRRDIVTLVKMIADVPGIDTLAMTTNGTLLSEYAENLRGAGLDRVNISLDSLRPATFAAITRRDCYAQAIEGIAAAQRAGLEPVKLNVVVMRGVNDAEIPEFVEFAVRHRVEIRFIEYMPHRDTTDNQNMAVSGREILDRIRESTEIEPVRVKSDTRGPAELYRIAGTPVRLGIISSVSQPFCRTCNRLRLQSDGMLVACLYEGGTVNLKQLLRSGTSRSEIRQAFETVVGLKPRVHSCTRSTTMNRLGG